MYRLLFMVLVIHCFFFFQAEDGIRDRDVTGVQTCALPISYATTHASAPGCMRRSLSTCLLSPRRRSEERRVGKECKCRRLSQPARKRRLLCRPAAGDHPPAPRPLHPRGGGREDRADLRDDE